MYHFKRDYGTLVNGEWALGTVFLSVSASIIYVGEFVGAILAAPINDKFGRKAVFASASVCIVIGAIVQLCAYGIDGVFYVGRVFVGLGVGQFTATCLIYVADVAPTVSSPVLVLMNCD
jgi:MFS family permease